MERLINYSRALAPSDAPNRTLPRRTLSVFLGPAFDAEALRSYSCSPDLFPGNDVHRQISPDIGVRKQRFSLSPVTPPSPVLPPPSYGKGKEMEEGVLVMDGLLVNTFTKQQHKSSLMESTSSSSSNGSGDWAMGTLYKTDICRAWDDRGACRYGSKCQFAHGKEELRPVMRFPKNKGEVCRSSCSLGPCKQVGKCHHPVPLGLKSYLHEQGNIVAAFMFGLAKDDSTADNSGGSNEYIYSYSSPSSYHPNSNPRTIISPTPPYADYSMGLTARTQRENLVSREENFLRAAEALDSSIKREEGAINIEALKQAGARFFLTEAEALHYCMRTKVFGDGCPSPAMAARCSRKRLPIFSSICPD